MSWAKPFNQTSIINSHFSEKNHKSSTKFERASIEHTRPSPQPQLIKNPGPLCFSPCEETCEERCDFPISGW